MRNVFLTGCFSVVFLGFAATAAAQPTSLSDCAGIADDTERLACFDALSETSPAAPAPDPMSAPAEPSAAAPAPQAQVESEGQKDRRLFGFRLPGQREVTEEEFGKPELETNSVDRVVSVIKGIEFKGDTAYRIQLENGQVWEQNSSDDNYLKFASSDSRTFTATVKRAAFGSFRMTVEPLGRTIRVRRVE